MSTINEHISITVQIELFAWQRERGEAREKLRLEYQKRFIP